MLLQLALISLALAPTARAQCATWAPHFELGGLGPVSPDGRAGLVHDDGSGPALYVGGAFTGTPGPGTPYLARWNGTAWSSVGTGVNGAVNALVEFDAGSGTNLYAGGTFNTAGGVSARGIACWDGAAWSALGDLNGVVHELAVHDDGGGARLHAAGSFSIQGGPSGFSIARWDGASWSLLGSTDGIVRAMRSHDDGSGPALVVAGEFSVVDGQTLGKVVRRRAGSWEVIGGAFQGTVVRALEVHDDGSGLALFAAGDFYTIGDQQILRLAKWNGSAWSVVGSFANIGHTPQALRSYDDGSGPSLFVSAVFVPPAGIPHSGVQRWDGFTWHVLGSGISHFTQDFVPFDDGSGSRLVAIGSFALADGRPVDGLASWGNGGWSQVGVERSVRGRILTMTDGDLGAGQRLFVAGDFKDAGGVVCNDVATWDGIRFEPLAGGIPNLTELRSLCVYDGGSGPRLYAGGFYSNVNGNEIHALHVCDGQTWTPIPSSARSVLAMCVHDDGNGPALIVAARQPDFQATAILRFDGTTWTTLGTAQSANANHTPVFALASYDDGTGPALYVGGRLLNFGSEYAPYLMRYRAGVWSGVGSGIAGDYGYTWVTTLHVSDLGDGPALYVGGRFPAAGSTQVDNVARWDGAWSALASADGAEPLDTNQLATFDPGDGRGPILCVTGRFLGADGYMIQGVATWDGERYAGLTPASAASVATAFTGGPLTSIGVFDEGGGAGPDLFIGGEFASIEGVQSYHVARRRNCGETGASFCFGDGSAAACPCGNASAVGARAGCANSLGVGATIRAHGTPSLSNDTLVLEGGSMPDSSVLYFQGASLVAGGSGVAFGDGLSCVGGPFVRLGTKVNSGGASSYPLAGDAAIHTRGFVAAPGTRHYGARYRNAVAFCTSDTFNYASAVTIVWGL